MDRIFKITVHRGADNCFGEARWFYNIYRNYAKRSFLERILTFNPAFGYHDFAFWNVSTLSADYFSHSIMRTYPYISGTFIHFALMFHDMFA